MTDYETEVFEKVATVIRAALQNPGHRGSIELKTSGYEPSASVSVPAYIFKKFWKMPETAI